MFTFLCGHNIVIKFISTTAVDAVELVVVSILEVFQAESFGIIEFYHTSLANPETISN